MPLTTNPTSCDASRSKLSRALSGDLDNIVLKALRKEPERRYVSVEQFAQDLHRHLDGLPVLAVKGSRRYRAGKFIRRNRVGIMAGSAVALALIIGVVATIRQARIARRQAEIAKSERARAEKRFNDVRELANSLIFEIHDSIQSLPGATPSRKLLLDRAVTYLDKLSQDANGDANLQRELAWAYHRLATVQGDTSQSNLGEVKAADVSNQKAMSLFEAVARANPKNVTDQLNLAMAYRWRAFFDIYEPTGRAEIQKALDVTQPLLSTNTNNLELKSELAREYEMLADIQDAMGDRLLAIESFRKVIGLQQEILQANPAYPNMRQGTAKIQVMMGHEIGRFGAPDEGLQILNAAIADMEAFAKQSGGDPRLVREVGAAEGRRGDVELRQGNIAAARADFQDAHKRVERLAKLDPENKMLQSDIWVADFEDARTLAVAGRYAQALPLLERSYQGYKSLKLEADVGPGPAQMQAWIGEAHAGLHNYASALKNYQAAEASLAEDQASFDDARCDLAMVQSKIGDALLKMGKPGEAEAAYDKSLTTANLPVSLDHNDFPALYAAAEAYAGKAEVLTAEAQKSVLDSDRARLTIDACTTYEKSLEIWKHMSNPPRYSGNGYLARDPAEIEQRVAACKAASGPR